MCTLSGALPAFTFSLSYVKINWASCITLTVTVNVKLTVTLTVGKGTDITP